MIERIEQVLSALEGASSQQPISDKALANVFGMTPDAFNTQMQAVINMVPAPVNRVFHQVGDNACYKYWPTGVVNTAAPAFKIAAPKEAVAKTEKSIPAVSADSYETPVFVEPSTADDAVTEIEKIIDAPTKPTIASDRPDYSDKPKAYQMLKYIETHPGCTNREIVLALGMDAYASVNPYIKTYIEVKNVLVEKSIHGQVYRLTKPVEEFYRHRKPLPVKQPEATQIDATPDIKPTHKAIADKDGVATPAQNNAVEALPETSVPLNKTQVADDYPAAKVRFAITSDKHIILMALTTADIELTEHDSHTLIQFCGDIALAANVSAVLADKMIDLETLR